MVLFVLLFPSVGAFCEPVECEWATYTNKVVDWIVCTLIAIMLGDGDWTQYGYYGYFP